MPVLHRKINRLVLLGLGIALSLAARPLPAAQEPEVLEIRSVEVGDKSVRCQRGRELNLEPFPANINFIFGAVSNAPHQPLRLRARLDGYETAWHGGNGEMFLTIRFYNDAGDQVAQQKFSVHGESLGWDGTLEGSPLTHRRETVQVPPGASRFWVVISSAGPPTTIGVYVVEDLIVSKLSPGQAKAQLLLRAPPGPSEAEPGQLPGGWERDGTKPSMAKVVTLGQGSRMSGFAIVDDDPAGHAEWHTAREIAPAVAPNETLVVEWNEMYSMGVSDYRYVHYPRLTPGRYQLRVAELTVFGQPVGPEACLAVRVLQPYWETTWFWTVLAGATVGMLALSARFLTRRRMQQEVARLQQQRALEQERLRIARDIHDDLGARVTQISLLSGMAQKDATFSERARAEFSRISVMSQDLVSALYETVWAVAPENDHLEAMADFLCQRIDERCKQAGLRCRIHVSPFPQNTEISSRARHNLNMAANEAVHNIIKHAKASQVILRIALEAGWLTVSIQDDGCGFPCGPAGPVGTSSTSSPSALSTPSLSPSDGVRGSSDLSVSPAPRFSDSGGSDIPTRRGPPAGVESSASTLQPLNASTSSPPGRHGLANMQRRLEDIGGTCVIESKPGGGTTVRLRLNVQSTSQEARAGLPQGLSTSSQPHGED